MCQDWRWLFLCHFDLDEAVVITDYFSTHKITTPWRRNTYTHFANFVIKYALTKAHMPDVVLKPTKPNNEY